jgi:hypothetical protein
MRYLERMRKATMKQNEVYNYNVLKNQYVSEKEKYAKHLEKCTEQMHHPFNILN